MFLIPNLIEENVEYPYSTATSACTASVRMLSGPAALPLLICLMATLIFLIVGGPTLIGRSEGAASILGGFSEAGRFKSSLMCSSPLFHCSSMFVITSPSLLFTGSSSYYNFQQASLLCHTVVSCFLLLQPFPPSLLNLPHIYVCQF
ncbi:unnamed protein product [Schistosoma margrebowiei]|uniref:Uncharacterized protein n=1 Tax=Schistosoma margrebowiei TaxID=48269 RepID=A0A3P8A0W7_9TREM|nr:unnamed protein product [Schistosoma margrebowiei]